MRDNDPLSELIRSIEEDLQGGDREPPPRQTRQPEPQGNPRRLLWFLIPLLIFIFFNRGLGFYTDWIWYNSLDLEAVFLTRVYASFGLFLVTALLFWGFLAVNVFMMRRLEPQGIEQTPLYQTVTLLGLRATPVVLALAGVVAVFIGLTASTAWEEVLIYLNQLPFNLADPIFNWDVSFFMFTLPIWQAARTWLMTVVFITLLATGFVSGVGWRDWSVRTPVLLHFCILGALFLLLVAWGYRLDAYQLVYSERGAAFGAGYADIHAQLPAYNILAVVTGIVALLLLVTAFLRQTWRAIVVVLVLWFVVSIVAGNVYPGLVQRFQVSPNELNLEGPYIEDNIKFTRIAFGLDQIEVRNYDASQPLTASDLIGQPETMTNIRLWDYRPLEQTYNQVQALRQYYHFNDIDIDRYMIDGEVRQVMLAARELVPEQLNETAQTWVNRKLVYTHGYGVAMSPVAKITRDGLPEFLIKDLPPQGSVAITVPQIYFGELTNDYVIAGTDEPEFDYPSEDEFQTTHFSGNTGIGMNLVNRLLFALRFADINLVLNSDITTASQLLWRRNITERISEVAPFLLYDSDPYIVIGDDGKLYWMLDAYTLSHRFPYSEPMLFETPNYRRMINYIRNPVKVVTSAYDGTMRFYLFDETEPIASAYARIFPDLFASMAEMPPDLLAHIRYPNGLFGVQAEVLRTYHMINVNEFYNKEDLWAWPEEIYDGEPQRMEPYYVLMELPGSDTLNFIQILPFTPANRENMVAWLAAQNDPERYGDKLVYLFGKDSLIYGPKQVEARIDQDPTISAQLSLWDQQGSNVIRGNLLVIPIDESLIYVEPLYLQAANGRIPELKRVILATANEVVMAENLGLALAELFGPEIVAEGPLAELLTVGGPLPGSAGSVSSPSATGAPIVAPTLDENATLDELIVQANRHYEQAQTYLQERNWAGYGAEMNALQAVLQRLADLTGLNQPTPTPAAASGS